MSEWKRRAKAAIAIAGLTEREIARRFGTNVKTYNDRLQGGPTRLKQSQAQGLAESVAVECGLPRAFATADWRLLEAQEAADRLEQVLAALARRPADDQRGLAEWLGDLAQQQGYPPGSEAGGEGPSGSGEN